MDHEKQSTFFSSLAVLPPLESLQTQIYQRIFDDQNEVLLFASGREPIHGVDSIDSAILPFAILALDRFKPDLMINAGSNILSS